MKDRTCAAGGCERLPNGARGLCKTHYSRWRRATLADPAATAAWRAEQQERDEARRRQAAASEKPCTQCRRVQPKSEFPVTPRTRDGRHSWCKACLRSLANKHYDSGRARARYQAKKDDPRYRAIKKAAYDRWRKEHPERMAAASADWRRRNPEAVSLHNRVAGQRRRAERVAPVRDPLTTKDYRGILLTHGMTCHICLGPIDSFDDLHFDHVIPLARGGAHHADNIRPAHARCNLRKGARIA